MSWVIPWNGKEYDVDPLELTGLELSAIKQRTGLRFTQLVGAIAELDGDAIRALFWAVERRDNSDLNFSDYAGPPLSAVLPHISELESIMDAVGKALDPKPKTESNGSDGSPNSTESDPPMPDL